MKISDDYRAKLTIYNFTYTGCSAGCPPTSQFMQALREKLSQINVADVNFALVTISVDPEHDTPASLKSYADQFQAAQANPIGWDWLVGDAQRIVHRARPVPVGSRLRVTRYRHFSAGRIQPVSATPGGFSDSESS